MLMWLHAWAPSPHLQCGGAGSQLCSWPRQPPCFAGITKYQRGPKDLPKVPLGVCSTAKLQVLCDTASAGKQSHPSPCISLNSAWGSGVMLLSGINPSIFSLILPSEGHAGVQRDTIPLLCAQRLWTVVAARQSCFLQHSAAIVQLGSGPSHPHQAGRARTSAAQQHRQQGEEDGWKPLEQAAHLCISTVQLHCFLDFCTKDYIREHSKVVAKKRKI